MTSEDYFSTYKVDFTWEMVFENPELKAAFKNLDGYYPNDFEKKVLVAFAISRFFDPYEYEGSVNPDILEKIWYSNSKIKFFLDIRKATAIYNSAVGGKAVKFLANTKGFDWKYLLLDKMLKPYRYRFTLPEYDNYLLSGEEKGGYKRLLEIDDLVF